MSQRTHRVAIVEDHPIYLEGLAQGLSDNGITVVATADSIRALDEADVGDGIDVLIADLGLPDACRRTVLGHVNALVPGVPILVLTAHTTTEDLTLALAEGAKGYLRKDAEIAEVIEAIASVTEGRTVLDAHAAVTLRSGASGFELTARQLEILGLIGHLGLSDTQIAGELHISEKTVRRHIEDIRLRVEGWVSSEGARGLARLAHDTDPGCRYCQS